LWIYIALFYDLFTLTYYSITDDDDDVDYSFLAILQCMWIYIALFYDLFTLTYYSIRDDDDDDVAQMIHFLKLILSMRDDDDDDDDEEDDSS
jgi:hypothetical protein